jgi:hypothetical protein
MVWPAGFQREVRKAGGSLDGYVAEVDREPILGQSQQPDRLLHEGDVENPSNEMMLEMFGDIWERKMVGFVPLDTKADYISNHFLRTDRKSPRFLTQVFWLY